MRKLITGIVVVWLAACGRTTEPTTADLSGSWSGTISSATSGAGTLGLTLSQSSNSLSGTWTATFSSAQYNNHGTLTGTVSGSSVSMVLTATGQAACPINVSGTLSGSTSISGSYVGSDCTTSSTGTFSATKQ